MSSSRCNSPCWRGPFFSVSCRRRATLRSRPILSNPCGTAHGFPVPELSPWRWCPDHPDADGEDQAYRDNEANEDHRKAVPFVVSNIRFPIACGPALHGFIIAGQRDAEGSWWGAGGLIIGAKRGSTWIEHRVLVPRPTTINVTLEHRHGRATGGRGWIHRLDGVRSRDVRMIRQATLLDDGSVAPQNTAVARLEITNMPHRAHLLKRPSCLGCAGPLEDIVVFPDGSDANTFVRSCFMSMTGHPCFEPSSRALSGTRPGIDDRRRIPVPPPCDERSGRAST